MEDRLLLEQEMIRLSAAGWEIVSQSDTGFQVRQVHTVSGMAMVILVLLPTILGMLVALFSAVWASALFSLALVFGALLAIEHLTVAPKLLYMTANQLRAQAQNPNVARITPNGKGGYTCSACNGGVALDATTCKHCKKPLAATAAAYLA